MNNCPKWLEEAPKWFQKFYSNDHIHLVQKVEWSWRLQLLTLAAILGGAIAIICKVL
jgi:hypothetical protein